MAQAQGYRAQLVIDFEDTFGETPAGATGFLMPIYSSKLQSKQNLVEDEIIRNDRNPAMPTLGNIDLSGSIEVPVDQLGIGYWLKAMFGAPESDGELGKYTHIYKPAFGQPSLVLEQGFTDISQYFLSNGCKVGKFSIEFGGEGDVKATIDVMGAKETIGVASFTAEPTEITLTKYGHFQAAIKEGGDTLAKATKGTLELDFTLDGDTYVIGAQGNRGSINDGTIQISGSITTLFENATLLSKAMSATESSLTFTLSGDADKSLEFSLPEVLFERNSPPIEGPKGVMVELGYRAYYENNADKAAIKVTLKNAQESYA